MPENRVILIGAGLAGSLLATYLARRGMRVTVFEARPDMRREKIAAGRSINLALSDRGIAALREIGMDEYMLAEAVPMYGRMIHTISGETKLLPYSGRKGEYINSVSRAGLNIALMNEAEKYDGVQFVFNERCTDFDLASGEVSFESGRTSRADTVIATDGAGSAVRSAMERDLPGFHLTQLFLEHGYKELQIPPAADWTAGCSPASGDPIDDSRFLIEKNALHIWPRHKFMMIALPNFDGSFTCTLFLAHTGRNLSGSEGAPQMPAAQKGTLPTGRVSASVTQPSFDGLTTEVSILDFFNREFPDAVPLMPTLTEDFLHNPTGHLGTIECWPWNVEGKALLLGDSAHAVVPFYGQGMNCAFEDVRILDQLIEKHGTDWTAVYKEYGRLRKINTDAIADMAEENFYEMRDRVADPVFQRKRELETELEQAYPDYFSKYSMVTFREDLPYSVAKEKGNAQDRLLMRICADVKNVGEIDLDETMEAVRRFKPEDFRTRR
jgi:kynurenine 3-monooxygenase